MSNRKGDGKGGDISPDNRGYYRGPSPGSSKGEQIHIPMITGNVDRIIDKMNKRSRKDPEVIKKAFEVLIGLSLKGHEGKSVGAIFLIGDMEGVRRNTNQLIANPFKGYYRRINILDPKNRRTLEAYSQLDGAIVIDNTGNLSSAGRVIDIRTERRKGGIGRETNVPARRGGGTRDRAAQYITSVTNTLALTLSCDGDLTVYERGRCLGKLTWGVRTLDPEDDLYRLFTDDQ